MWAMPSIHHPVTGLVRPPPRMRWHPVIPMPFRCHSPCFPWSELHFPEPVRSPMQRLSIRADRVFDTLLTGSRGLLAAMEPVADLERVQRAGSNQRTHPRRRQPDPRLLQWRSGPRNSHCPSSSRRPRRQHDVPDVRRPTTRSDKQAQMHVTHDTQQNRPLESGTELRHTRIRSHTRIAHSTLSTPHAPATRCRRDTGRPGR